jgi:hypothetical protein
MHPSTPPGRPRTESQAPVKATTKIRMNTPEPRLTMRPYGVSGSLTGAALTSDMSCV